MIKSKVCSAIAGLVMSLGIAGAANALTIESGDFKMILDNYDSATTQYGTSVGIVCNTIAGCDATATPAPGSIGSVNGSADSMGIFSVASITRISTGAAWFTRSVDGYLTGIFGNLEDYTVEVSGTLNPLTSVLSTGGTFDLFLNAADYDPTLGPLVTGTKDLNNALYPSISAGTLVLAGAFNTGILAGDSTTTFTSTYNSNSLVGGSGGYLDVTGGNWQSLFDTNGEIGMNGEKRDLLSSFTYRPNSAATANGWTVISSGDITGNVPRHIPEPGSLALVALALLGVGSLSRRNNKA